MSVVQKGSPNLNQNEFGMSIGISGPVVIDEQFARLAFSSYIFAASAGDLVYENVNGDANYLAGVIGWIPINATKILSSNTVDGQSVSTTIPEDDLSYAGGFLAREIGT